MSKRVLLVGLQGSSVDFAKWPGLSRASLEAAFETVQTRLRAEGFETAWCLTDDGATAEQVLADAIATFRPDIVSIGAGIRADPDLLPLFEALVNRAHQAAPGARFAFNTDPLDTIASVLRAAGPSSAG